MSQNNNIKPTKSALKQRTVLNSIASEVPKYIAPNPQSYEQKPYAFMLDANVQDSYSAYRLNSNMSIQSAGLKPNKIRQGFYGEVYTLDNQYGGLSSSNYMISRPNPSTENNQAVRGGSLTRMDSWQDQHQHQPHQEYLNYYPPQPNQYPHHEHPKLNPSHSLIYKNYIGAPPSHMAGPIPSVNPHMRIMPNYPPLPQLPQPQPMPLPLPIPVTQSKKRFVRQNTTENSLLRVENLMKNNNSHLEKLVSSMDEQRRADSYERELSLGSPVRGGTRDSPLLSISREASSPNMEYFSQKQGKSLKNFDDSPTRLPGLISPFKNGLGVIYDSGDDETPKSRRRDRDSKKKDDNMFFNLLEKIISPRKPRKSGQYLPGLRRKSRVHRNKSPSIEDSIMEEEKTPSKSRHIVLEPVSPKPKPKRGTIVEPKHEEHKVHKKKEKKVNLKGILWSIAYPALLAKIVDKKINGLKEKYQHGALKMIQDQKTKVLEFLNKHCAKPLQSLYKEGKVLSLVVENEEADPKIPEKELKKRFSLILTKLSAIMESVKHAISEANLAKPLIDFLVEVSDKHAIVPPKFLTEFEVSCLDISFYGTLKNLTPIRVKVLIGIFFFVKGLIYIFLTQPWSFLPKMKETLELTKKLRPCSSILYHIIMDYFKEHSEINRNNQVAIPPEKRIMTSKNPLSAFTDADDFRTPHHEILLTEVMIGLHSKEDLKICFESDKPGVDKLKGLVLECIDKLYSVVQVAREAKKEKTEKK